MKEEKRRLVLIEGYAKAHPLVQAMTKAHAGDFNAALVFMKDSGNAACQAALDEIWERVSESLAAGHKWAKTRTGMYGFIEKDGNFVVTDPEVAARGSYALMAQDDDTLERIFSES